MRGIGTGRGFSGWRIIWSPVSSIIIYYFTGTGNSRRVADWAAAAWRERGAEVTVQSITGNLSFPQHKKADYIGIVAPVYGFGLPQQMARFIQTLPDGTGKDAFVFIATGNAESLPWGSGHLRIPPSEGIALLQARHYLQRRDYTVRCAVPVEMPTNWTVAVTPPGQVRQSVLFEQAQAAVAHHVEALYTHQTVIARTPLLLAPLFALTYGLFVHIGRRVAGKCFTATRRCNRCGYCKAHCPVGAIGWVHHRPYWGWNCQQCFRCVNFCPRGAIDVPWVVVLVVLAAMIIGYMPYDLLPVAWLNRLGPWNVVGATAVYLLVTGLVVWLLHYLHVNPLFRALLPRWYVMGGRTRYREPHFEPEARVLAAPRRRKIIIEDSPKPQPTILVKQPEEAGTLKKPRHPVEPLPPTAPPPKRPKSHGAATSARPHSILVKPTADTPPIEPPLAPVEPPPPTPAPPPADPEPASEAPQRQHKLLVKPSSAASRPATPRVPVEPLPPQPPMHAPPPAEPEPDAPKRQHKLLVKPEKKKKKRPYQD